MNREKAVLYWTYKSSILKLTSVLVMHSQESIRISTAAWVTEWSTSIADFLAGQFSHLLPYLEQKYIYFAGEHISMRHEWIVGALDSAVKRPGLFQLSLVNPVAVRKHAF